MLLHAVCVSFSKERRKKKGVKLARVVPDVLSSQHGAVDLDYIPFHFFFGRFCIIHALVQMPNADDGGHNPVLS